MAFRWRKRVINHTANGIRVLRTRPVTIIDGPHFVRMTCKARVSQYWLSIRRDKLDNMTQLSIVGSWPQHFLKLDQHKS